MSLSIFITITFCGDFVLFLYPTSRQLRQQFFTGDHGWVVGFGGHRNLAHQWARLAQGPLLVDADRCPSAYLHTASGSPAGRFSLLAPGARPCPLPPGQARRAGVFQCGDWLRPTSNIFLWHSMYSLIEYPPIQ